MSIIGSTESSSTVDPYTVFLSNSIVKKFKGKVVVGLRQVNTSDIDKYSTANPPPVPSPGTGYISSPYNIFIYASSCQYFDEKKGSWSSQGCTVNIF